MPFLKRECDALTYSYIRCLRQREIGYAILLDGREIGVSVNDAELAEIIVQKLSGTNKDEAPPESTANESIDN